MKDNCVKNYGHLESFVIFTCFEGVADITGDGMTETVKMGETVLFPALTNEMTLNSKDAKLLEVYVTGMTMEI